MVWALASTGWAAGSSASLCCRSSATADAALQQHLLDVRLQGARAPVLAPAARSRSGAAVCSAVPAAQGRGGTPLLPLRAANVNLNHGRTKCIIRTCKGKPSALHLPVCCTIATKATS